MNKPFTPINPFNGWKKVLPTLLILTIALVAFGQQAPIQHQAVSANLGKLHPVKLEPGIAAARASHIPQGSGVIRSTTCDTDLLLDYNAYNEVVADQQGITYNGSVYDGTQYYANGLSSFVTQASGDSGYVTSAGVIYDSLVFSDPIGVTSGYLPLATSTVYFDSLGMYVGLFGDSTKMANDSVIIYIWSETNGVLSTNPVKTIVYHGWAQLKQFYTYSGYGYLLYDQIPVHLQLTQGQGFAMEMYYRNKYTSSEFNLLYSYEDSCGTVLFDGNTYDSPAYPSPLLGNNFWNQIVDSTASNTVLDFYTNNSGYFNDGFPLNCSYSYTQNWEFVPLVTVCATTPTASCTPSSGVPYNIVPAPANVPCVAQGVNFSQTYTIGIPSTLTVAGNTVNVISATIDSIGNLPAGLTWLANDNPATYAGGTSGCYIISGTTNAACGTYLLPVYITADVSLFGTVGPITIRSVDSVQFSQQFLRVNASGNSCQTLDTLQTASFVANPSCAGSSALGATITSSTNVSCFGGDNGTATVTATGGTGTYTYQWSANANSATTAGISNLAIGTYTVTVTSGSSSVTASVTITQPAAALAANVTATATSCTGNTGTATAAPTGGTPAYAYHWSYNNATSAGLTALPANTYTVTVTDSKGCTATGSGTVNPPASISVNVTTTNVNCYGQSTGTATANPSGGTGYTYSWSNNGTSQTINNLPSTTYTVTVTASNSCTATATGTVTQPASALSASATTTQTSCASNTGTATVTATGGTAGYTYEWNNSLGTGTEITGLGVGTYSVTVTDNKGCMATADATINTSATYTLNVTSTNINCYGQNTGTATATVTGANGTVTYAWTNTSQTTSLITGLAANTYGVTVTDGSGCSKAGSTTITQPASALSTTAIATPTACSSNTGTITVAATGGTPAYTYSWSNSSTANPVTGLGAGPVTCTVTDSKGCTSTVSGTVSLPPTFSVSVLTDNVTCYNQSTGSATATVNGTGTFTYFWSNGGTSSTISSVPAGSYAVTVTNGFGCTVTGSGVISQPNSGVSASTTTTQTSCTGNIGTATVNPTGGQSPYNELWGNQQTGLTITGLAAGNYPVTVTDAGGCTAAAVASVSSPATFTLTIDTTGVQCYGASTGSVTASVTGGTQPFTYNWSNSVTTASNSGVTAGTYNVTVTDGNGCSKAASGVVTQPATALVAHATSTNSTCGTSSGTASVSVVGGNGSPSYAWNNSASSSTITNLSVGVYSVTVTEGNCTASSSAIVNNLNGPTISILQNNPTCPGGSNGSATAVPSGGTSPYSFTWNTSATGNSITGVTAGTYTVIVVDSTGCEATNTVTLVAPAPITFNPAITNENCAGGDNGSIVLSAGGGTGPYTYNWSNNGTTSSITGVSSNTYTVTVTDSRQCTAASTFNITQPVILSVLTTSTPSTTGSNGTATANPSGGTLPYTFAWNNSEYGSTDTGLASGSYTVTVTDTKGCTASASVTVVFTSIQDITNVITNASIVPNPASDVVKVIVETGSAQNISFSVVDITGQSIYKASEITSQGRNIHEINISEFASGIYIVEIAAGNQVIRKRLVVTK